MINKKLDINEYHKLKQLGSSTIKEALKSSAHYKYLLENGFDKTAAMALGDAVHAAYLEPDRFEKMFERKSKKSKGEMVDYLESIDGGDSITPADTVKFDAMMKALNESKEAQALLDNKLMIEASFIGDEYKCRPDIITKDGWIIDLKTSSSQSGIATDSWNFAKKSFDLGYHIQAALYLRVVELLVKKKLKGFKFLVVDSTKKLSSVRIFRVDRNDKEMPGEFSEFLRLGNEKLDEALEVIKKYKEDGEAFVFEDVEVDMSLPSYAYSDEIDDEEEIEV